MNMPLDIKAVLDAMRDADAARDLPVRVHVYIEDAAPRDLVNVVMAATRSVSGNGEVLYDAYLPRHGVPDASADMAVLVAAGGEGTGRLYRDLQSVGVPTAVFASDGAALRSEAGSSGTPLSPEDVICPDRPPVAGALPDRAEDAPIALESDDARRMLDAFGRWVVGVFKDKRLAFAHAFPCVRGPLARESVNMTAVQNAGIGVVAIIPGADLPLMTLNQVKMLLEMAAAYGEELSLGRVKEILAIVGGALACRGAARQLVGVLPGVGWAVKGGIGYAGTMAMGRALMAYFERGADAVAVAQDAATAMRGVPAWIGVSADKGLAGNVRLVADAARDAAGKAAGNAVSGIGPAVSSVAAAAKDATGLTRDDVADVAGRVIGSLRGRVSR